jgi:rRNA maturation protein Nop10
MPRAWRAREFGGAAALDVEFNDRDRPATVTSLLATCLSRADGHGVDADEAWNWTLNERLHALIALRLVSNDSAMELHARCAHCGDVMEVAIDLQVLSSDAAVPRLTWRDEHGVEVTVRLPRGRDLQRWMRDGVVSHDALAASLIETVAGKPVKAGQPVPASWLPALDDALEEHDPLTALTLRTRCPGCGTDTSIACDLEQLLLQDFARMQSTLLYEVSRLATGFHWSEADILALPRWRRAHYLRQLDAGRWE